MRLTTVIMLAILITVTLNQCLYKCKTCDANRVCSQCQDGTFLANTNQCKRCPSQCVTCAANANGQPQCTGTSCADGSTLDSTNKCVKCSPRCQSCSSNARDCRQCRGGLSPRQNSDNTYSCTQTATCNSIDRCTACLTKAVTTGGAPQTPVTSQICQTCETGFFTFRRGCQRCREYCSACTYDAKSDWDNIIKPFWDTNLPLLATKAAQRNTARLLQTTYTQTYQLWNKTKYDAAAFTKAVLTNYDNMNPANVKGWTQAYYYFQAVNTQLPSGTDLPTMMYYHLPIMQQILDLSKQKDVQQWQHFARFTNNYLGSSQFRWTGPTLNKKIIQLAQIPATCSACMKGYFIANGACTPCTANCMTCTSANNVITCSACNDGYYIVNGACSACPTNCATCNNAGTCLSCVSPFSLTSTSTCVACTSPCRTCAAGNLASCTTCIEGYSIFPNNAGTCYQCTVTNCRQCQTTNLGTCQVCRQGFLLTNGACTACPANCAYCRRTNANANLICYQCSSGYTTVNGVCTKCADTCTACLPEDPNTCQTCQSNQYVDYVTGKCKTCRDGCSKCSSQNQCTQFQSGAVVFQGRRIRCRQGCLTCDATTPTLCTACSQGYYLQSQQCKRCSTGCLTCTNSATCTSCDRNFVLSNSACFACANGCRQCTKTATGTSCTLCARGYSLNNGVCAVSSTSPGCLTTTTTNAVTTCASCDNGYALLNGVCVQCAGYCTGTCTPTNITNCLSCMKGFYLADNRCVRCLNECSQCSSSTVCTTCVQGYTLNSTTSTCVKTCPFPCDTCAASACDTCSTGYTKTSDGFCTPDISCSLTSNCQTCLAGSYLQQGTLKCALCSTARCSTCSNNICSVCFDGYYLGSTSTTQGDGTTTTTIICTRCPTGCITCYDGTNCKTCSAGYVKQIAAVESGVVTTTNKCIACDANCATCVQYSYRCTSCVDGYRLKYQRCFGAYTVLYNYTLDVNYDSFVGNGRSEAVADAIVSKSGVQGRERHMYKNVRSGSTVVTGQISADNLAQATAIANNLTSQTTINNYNVLASATQVALNDVVVSNGTSTTNYNYNSNPDPNTRAVIIAASVIGGVALIAAIILTVCCICRKKQPEQTIIQNSQVPVVTQPVPATGQVTTVGPSVQYVGPSKQFVGPTVQNVHYSSDNLNKAVYA